MSEARAALNLNITEKQFQESVIELAQRLGWVVFHPFDMRRSRQGYPDLTLVHGDRGMVVWAELKREDSTKAKLSDDQANWLYELGEVARRINQETCYRRVFVQLWRPSDWPEIEAVLKGELR